MPRNEYLAPWASKSEWQDVRKKIYSESVEDVIEAYETMTMWQLRCDKLPAYVDCTAGILQVMIQEFKNEKSVYSDHDLRLSYSTALIRFVNHVHGISDNRKDSLYHSAKTQNIPDWLITMRHDAAHGQALPALETFHIAAKVALQWLLENYWVQEEKMISNLGERHFEDDITMNDLNMKLLPIYKTAIKVWVTCCDLMNNSLSLDSDMSEEHKSHIRELIQMCETSETLKKNGQNCVNWLKKIMLFCTKPDNFQPSRDKILKCLKIYLRELIKSITLDTSARYAFVQSLLQSDLMLDTTQNEWVNILHTVQSLQCFTPFLECLFELAGKENDMAINLLDTLLPSLQAQRSLWKLYQDALKDDKSNNISKELLKKKTQLKYKRKHKNVRIHLKLQDPPKITVEMVQNMLLNPTWRSCNLAMKYLTLIHPSLPPEIYYEIKCLISVYFGSEPCVDDEFRVPVKMYTLDNLENNSEEPDRIYTLDDIKDAIEKNTDDAVGGQGWGKSEESSETWSSCPLGLLPHQKKVDCKLPETVQWVPSSEGRKRASSTLLTSQADGMKKLKISLKNID